MELVMTSNPDQSNNESKQPPLPASEQKERVSERAQEAARERENNRGYQ
jgi:hypothetical protein